MNSADLTLFVYVANIGSFNKTAQLANLSNVALSKRMSNLEQALGVQFIHHEKGGGDIYSKDVLDISAINKSDEKISINEAFK